MYVKTSMNIKFYSKGWVYDSIYVRLKSRHSRVGIDLNRASFSTHGTQRFHDSTNMNSYTSKDLFALNLFNACKSIWVKNVLLTLIIDKFSKKKIVILIKKKHKPQICLLFILKNY